MPSLSQNKKIAISAIAVFIVSFSIMLFFLGKGDDVAQKSQTNLMDFEHEEGKDGGAENADDVKLSEIAIAAIYKPYLEDVTAPFFVIDVEGNFQYLSEKFCQLMLSKCEQLKNKKLFDFVNSKDLSDFVSVHTKLIQNGKDLSGIGPLRMITGEKEKLLLLNAKLLKGKKSKIELIIFSVKDLTQKANELKNHSTEKNVTQSAEEEQGENDQKTDGDNEEATEKKDSSDWIDDLYPKIKEMRDTDPKLLVDKVGVAGR